MEAATSDNVQVKAIWACQQFGVTLAMSPDTVRRIHEKIVPTPPPAVFQFIQASIGYAANNCVTQLAGDIGGERFLALASALVTSMEQFKSAQAIQAMVEDSASDKSLVPTLRHVSDLMKAIEPRCHRAGFVDEVCFWQYLLGNAILGIHKSTWQFPDTQGVAGLVEAFRQLGRVGNADITEVVVRTTACAPWTAAFTKWCLGYPPGIFRNDGTFLVGGRDSAVSIFLEAEVKGESNMDVGSKLFDVTIHSSVKGPSELVAALSGGPVVGMVGIGIYGRRLLQHLDLDRKTAQRAFSQALPYALRQIHQKLIALASGMDLDPLGMDLLHYKLSPFPKESVVGRACALLLGASTPLDFRTLDPGLLVTDLPLVRLHMDDLGKSCPCHECFPDTNFFEPCQKSQFIENVGRVVEEIFALSLFNNLDDLRIDCGRLNYTQTGRMNSGIMDIIQTGEYAWRPPTDIIKVSLGMAGHEVDKSHWIISSHKGQAVWPTTYETTRYDKQGYLSLSWLPGLIRYKGESYTFGAGSSSSDGGSQPPVLDPNLSERGVSEPCDLFPDLHIRWQVSITPEHDLQLRINLKSADGGIYGGSRHPGLVFEGLACALVAERCEHPPATKLDVPDLSCTFTTVPNPGVMEGDGPIRVVPVAGRDDLRLYSVSCAAFQATQIVLRKDACLACCLTLCRRAGTQILVL